MRSICGVAPALPSSVMSRMRVARSPAFSATKKFVSSLAALDATATDSRAATAAFVVASSQPSSITQRLSSSLMPSGSSRSPNAFG